MALNKVNYVDGQTVITAENMNDIQDAIIALENAPTGGTVSDDLKQALLQLAQKVAYIDDQGQTYYDDLYNALYPPKTLVSISAVFDQGSAVIYDNASLDTLKTMLTVTAQYDDNTTEILPDSAYTLSGTLTVGTSTVTASYQGKTDTFDVTVTAAPTLSAISAVYTQSGTVYDTDTLDSLKADLVVTAHYSDSSTQIVPDADYILSGTLTAGTSTITVSYGGKTATFDVTVTEAINWDIEWDYTKGSPLNNGFVKDNGTASVMDGEYFALTPTQSKYGNLHRNPDFKDANGILEIVVKWEQFINSTKTQFINMPKLRLVVYGNTLRFVTDTSDNDIQIFSGLELSKDTTIRIVYGATSGATVFINGVSVYTWENALPYDTTRFLLNSLAATTIMYIRTIRIKSL